MTRQNPPEESVPAWQTLSHLFASTDIVHETVRRERVAPLRPGLSDLDELRRYVEQSITAQMAIPRELLTYTYPASPSGTDTAHPYVNDGPFVRRLNRPTVWTFSYWREHGPDWLRGNGLTNPYLHNLLTQLIRYGICPVNGCQERVSLRLDGPVDQRPGSPLRAVLRHGFTILLTWPTRQVTHGVADVPVIVVLLEFHGARPRFVP